MNEMSRVVRTAGRSEGFRRKNTATYKIALYGFGSQPVVYRHLIELAIASKVPVSWCTIMPTPYYRSIISEVLPQNEILDVFRTLPRTPHGGDSSLISSYPGSLIEDLAAQKRRRRKRTGEWILNRGIDYYRLFKEFLQNSGATHLFMPLVETPEAKIAIAAAQALGIGVIVPVDMRNMSGTYFSADCYETPPIYVTANPQSRVQAIEFIERFRENPTPARHIPPEITGPTDYTTLPDFIPALPGRMRQFVSVWRERPDIFDHDEVRRVVMANAGIFRNAIRGRRARLNAAQYDIADADALSKRFIYYPLQYTPEASINTPAPYFVEQIRVIDAIRFAMPSDCTLVVKEHPACLSMRPVDFTRSLRALPGVSVAKVSIPSIEIIKRAAVTITVTGTAAFEAFLLGCPALAFGPSISAWATGRIANLTNLRAELLDAIAHPPSNDFVIEQAAKLMSARYAFVYDTPRLPGEPMLRLHNLQAFLSGLLDHLGRLDKH